MTTRPQRPTYWNTLVGVVSYYKHLLGAETLVGVLPHARNQCEHWY